MLQENEEMGEVSGSLRREFGVVARGRGGGGGGECAFCTTKIWEGGWAVGPCAKLSMCCTWWTLTCKSQL